MKEAWTVKKIEEKFVKNKNMPDGEMLYKLVAKNEDGETLMLTSFGPFNMRVEQVFFVDVTEE